MYIAHLLFVSLALALKFCHAYCFVDQGKSFHRGRDYDFHVCNYANSKFQSCCIGNDTCYTGGICLSSTPYAATSGYYIGGCTDHTYSDASCRRHCRDLSWQDIVYNDTSNLWTCCQKLGSNDDSVDCRDPGNETFYAPAPANLQELSTISTLPFPSTSPLSTPIILAFSSTSTSSSTGTLTASSSPTPITSSHLSTAAKIGVGLGAFFGSSAVVIASLLIFLLRRVKRVDHDTTTQGISRECIEIAPVHQLHPAEANGESAIQEAFGVPLAELPLTRGR